MSSQIVIDTAEKFTEMYENHFHYFASVLGQKEAIKGMFQNAISEALKKAEKEQTIEFLELLNK